MTLLVSGGFDGLKLFIFLSTGREKLKRKKISMKISSPISFSTITDVHNSMFNSNGFVCDHLETEESIRFHEMSSIPFNISSRHLFCCSFLQRIKSFCSNDVAFVQCQMKSNERHQMCPLKRKNISLNIRLGEAFVILIRRCKKGRCTFTSFSFIEIFRL